jgi:hypothetical protein
MKLTYVATTFTSVSHMAVRANLPGVTPKVGNFRMAENNRTLLNQPFEPNG